MQVVRPLEAEVCAAAAAAAQYSIIGIGGGG